MEMGASGKVGRETARVQGSCRMAVCILIQIGKVGPVLAEDGSGQKEGAVRRFQLIAEGLPLEKVRLCLGVRLLHTAENHIHEL